MIVFMIITVSIFCLVCAICSFQEGSLATCNPRYLLVSVYLATNANQLYQLLKFALFTDL